MSKRSLSFSSALALLGSILIACAAPAPTTTPESLPTFTETPAMPLAILLAPPESDLGLQAIAAEITAAYAASNSLQFEQRSVLNATDLPRSLQTLVVLAPDPGTAALAAAAPQAHVITIGFSIDGVANATNLEVGGGDIELISFVAGYVAAMSAKDWRVGILYSGESLALVNDFTAGASYFCGSCAPFSPPLEEYPAAAQAADATNWQSAVDQLLALLVNVVYLTPEMEASGAAQFLANNGVLLIGTGIPPADLAGSWLVSVSSDSEAALRELLPIALSGQPIENARFLSLRNPNADLFSQSRQENVSLIIDDLLAGLIVLPND